MDGQSPAAAACSDMGISLEDGEGDAMFLQGLCEDEAGNAGPDDEDVWWFTFRCGGESIVAWRISGCTHFVALAECNNTV